MLVWSLLLWIIIKPPWDKRLVCTYVEEQIEDSNTKRLANAG